MPSDALADASARLVVHRNDVQSAEAGLLWEEQQTAELIVDDRLILLVWRSPQALIVGPSDTSLRYFKTAANHLQDIGWPVLIRHSGGNACPVTPGTIQFALLRRAVAGVTIETAYADLADLLSCLLRSYGLQPVLGLRPGAFCPGRYDISIEGRKVAGLSQRWKQHHGHFTISTSATLLIDIDPPRLAHVVNLFYEIADRRPRCLASAIGTMSAMLNSPPKTEILVDDVLSRLERFDYRSRHSSSGRLRTS